VLVEDALRFARATLPSTVEIVQDLDAGAPAVLRDPTQVHQVLLNLCTNAEHAMRPKGGTLRVALAPRDVGPEEAERLGSIEPGPYAALTVSDTGCGMSPGTRDRLFEPFFTTKPARIRTGTPVAG